MGGVEKTLKGLVETCRLEATVKGVFDSPLLGKSKPGRLRFGEGLVAGVLD